MPRFITMTTLSCLIATLAQPVSANPTRKIHTHPAPKPNVAQICASGTTHGLVFKTFSALSLYCHDTASVGQTLPLQAYVDEGAATLIPNGTRLEILSPRVQSIPQIGATYVQIRMLEGYWKGHTGYILWDELASLPKVAPKKKSPSHG